MIETFVLFVLIFSNSRMAARKGRNSFGWALLTLAAYMIVAGFCGAIYILITYKGPMTPLALQDYVLLIQHDVLKSATILLFGIGGGLIIRFILEKMTAKNVRGNSIT